MKMVRFSLVGLLIGTLAATVFGGFGVGRSNLTDFLRHRKKRGLIFENGGIAKIGELHLVAIVNKLIDYEYNEHIKIDQLVIGPIIAVPFADPVPWRSMICGYNIHVGEFRLPTSPLYPWDKWETIYARSQRNQRLEPDESREYIYLALEYFLEKTKGNGRECLLRSICENAQIDRHMDMFGEILNVMLTPGKENLDPVYKEAYEMGKSGVDCIHYYRLCPKGEHFFDQFIEEDV